MHTWHAKIIKRSKLTSAVGILFDLQATMAHLSGWTASGIVAILT